MRDLLVLLLVFGSLPYILKRPYIGVLVWSWLSYMNPHRLTWGFAYSMPFAQIVIGVLVISMIMSKEPKGLPKSGTLTIWIMFILWMMLTTALAIYPHYAVTELSRVLKIQFATFLTMMLIRDQEKMNQLIWVIAMSIGFFSIKGGVFTILSGGSFRVWGPPGSFIEDNNGLAVATLMVIPLMIYLRHISTNKWVRHGLSFSVVMSFASAIGSQSRGALLATLAVGGFFWLKSKSKMITGSLFVVAGVIGLAFMPESWYARMDTIQNYQEDESAMGRINAWIYSINVASSRITGAGFNSWSLENYAIYNPDAKDVLVAHSIYFHLLADQGWIGLVMFLTILLLTWKNLSYVIRMSKDKPKFDHQNMLARMLQVSLIAYMSGGAFLSLSYFDLPWHMIALALLLRVHTHFDEPHKGVNRRRNGFAGVT